MKKLLLLLFVVSLFQVNAQKINKNGDGYSEVYQTDLTIKEVHQKVIEWIAVNYKSAKNVIELNTESRIILKGNFIIDMIAGDIIIEYRVSNTLSISSKPGKFKVDFIPTKITYEGTDVDSSAINQFITNEMFSEETFLEYSIEAAKTIYIQMGYSDKKAQKLVNKYVLPTASVSYKNYIDNRKEWDNSIKTTFKSIDDFVNSANEDW